MIIRHSELNSDLLEFVFGYNIGAAIYLYCKESILMKSLKRFRCVILIVLPLFFCVLLLAFIYGSDIDLIGGYQVSSPYNEGAFITGPPESLGVIGAYVDGYRVEKTFIIGHVSPERCPGSYDREIPGCFIIDIKSFVIKKGMSKSKWLSNLRGHGIITPPTLKRPDKFKGLLSKIGII